MARRRRRSSGGKGRCASIRARLKRAHSRTERGKALGAGAKAGCWGRGRRRKRL